MRLLTNPNPEVLPVQYPWVLVAAIYLWRALLFQAVILFGLLPLLIFPSHPTAQLVRVFIFLAATLVLEVFSLRMLLIRFCRGAIEQNRVHREFLLSSIERLAGAPEPDRQRVTAEIHELIASLRKLDAKAEELLETMPPFPVQRSFAALHSAWLAARSPTLWPRVHA
jgi:hypothetical protein